MYRNRQLLNIVSIAFFLAISLTVPVSAQTPLEILEEARSLASPVESLRLLERNLPSAGTLRPYFLLDLARFTADSGRWDESLAWSTKQNMNALPPAIADDAVYWYGQALVRDGKTGAAQALYRKRLDTGLVSNPLLYLAYFRIGTSGAESYTARFDVAFPVLKLTDPESFALSRYLGGITAVRAGEWSFASQSFARFSPASDSKFPDLAPWSHYYHAYSLYRLGRWSESIAEFTLYLDTWKNHPVSWQAATTATFAAIQAGKDAMPYAERAIRLAPTNADLAQSTLLASSVLIDKQRYSEAEARLSGIADGTATKGLTATSSRALFMMAELAVRQKQSELAEQRWLSLVSRFPKDPLAEEALYRSGEQWYIVGDWNRAATLFSRYRQTWSTGQYLDKALWSGGDSYNRSGKADLAILWWQELVSKYPKSSAAPRAFSELVAALRKKGEYQIALDTAKSYRTKYPSESKLDEMDREIDELLKLANGESPDTAALYTSYVQAKRASTAEGRSVGLRLAREYMGDFSKRDNSKEILREIISNAPRTVDSVPVQEKNTYASAWSLLGNIYREEADFKAASSAFLSAGTWFASIDGERSAEALYGAADSFIQSGKIPDARTTVETLANKWPDSVWTRRAANLMSSHPEQQ